MAHHILFHATRVFDVTDVPTSTTRYPFQFLGLDNYPACIDRENYVFSHLRVAELALRVMATTVNICWVPMPENTALTWFNYVAKNSSLTGRHFHMKQEAPLPGENQVRGSALPPSLTYSKVCFLRAHKSFKDVLHGSHE